jgi:hypothetical protein
VEAPLMWKIKQTVKLKVGREPGGGGDFLCKWRVHGGRGEHESS